MNLEKITEIRNLLLKNEKIGDIEFTSSNFDDDGNLIKEEISTITTEFCEIGSYGNIIYFTFVIYSNSFDNKLIDLLDDFSNFKIYGFNDFLNNYDLKDLENEVKKEKIFQINFNYSIDDNIEYLSKQYQEIKNIIIESKVKVINQLEIDLTKETS